MLLDGFKSKFAGCLLGAMVGDVIGAVVEAESPQYIKKTFANIDDLLKLEKVKELFGEYWTVGKYTDDTQMLLAVSEWLLSDYPSDQKALLHRLSSSFQPWRRYGPATQRILMAFKNNPDKWQGMADDIYEGGSYGNGSAIRVAPVGLRFFNDFEQIIKVSSMSSKITHAHPFAIQGAALQTVAVSMAVRTDGQLKTERVITMLRSVLDTIRKRHGYSRDVFMKKLDIIEKGLIDCDDANSLAEKIGTGVQVYESMPFALYCVLRTPDSFENAISTAVFAGGDTDSTACMTGAISGALLGEEAIPKRWIERVKEDVYSPEKVRGLALKLAEKACENSASDV